MAADTREHDLRPTAEERSEIVLHRLSFSPAFPRERFFILLCFSRVTFGRFIRA